MVQEVDLHQFTQQFFEFFHAQVAKLDHHRHGALQVTLTPELAEYFGKEQLKLSFQSVEPGNGYELVAHGSRIFDRMTAYLERRSALAVLNLPRRFAGGEELLRAVRPLNASIANLRMHEQMQRIILFNWRITYRADDKREELYSVLLDENGARIPHAGEPNAPSDSLSNSLDVDVLLADAESEPAETGEDGQLMASRLPAMVQLTRLAQIARKYAIYHADLRCVTYEAEILPRLYKTLNRLLTYYEQQIAEVYDAHDPSGEKRQALEEELRRKIAEETENHRLHVQVQLFSYAILQMPVAMAEITLSDGKGQAAFQIHYNRYTGDLQRPLCHACAQPLSAAAIDRNGHITCDDCLEQCASCLDVLCASCGVEACPVCGRENCDACSQICWACGARACHEHVSVCPVCGDAVCHACQSACGCCRVCQCRSHLRVDSVLAPDGSVAWVCAECAVRCPGCQQYSAQVELCNASGQRFCANCLARCARCGRRVGAGFYQRNPVDGQAYCLNCLVECSVCHSLAPIVAACSACGQACCLTCGRVCDLCHQLFCDRHAAKHPNCGHIVCVEHAAICGVGREDICTLCDELCGICERYYCANHKAVCRRCGCAYCSECVRVSGLCDTCATIGRDGVAVNLSDEPCAADANVALLAPRYSWLRASNSRYIIYLGQNVLMSSVQAVVEKTSNGHRVVSAQKIGFVDTIRRKLGG